MSTKRYRLDIPAREIIVESYTKLSFVFVSRHIGRKGGVSGTSVSASSSNFTGLGMQFGGSDSNGYTVGTAAALTQSAPQNNPVNTTPGGGGGNNNNNNNNNNTNNPAPNAGTTNYGLPSNSTASTPSLSSTGSTVTALGSIQDPTKSGYSSSGGSIHFVAGKSISVGKSVNAAGGFEPANGQGFTGPGGAVLMQGNSINIGASQGKSATVIGGSLTFITQYQGATFLLKPVVPAPTVWGSALNLTIGDGTNHGTIVASTPVVIAQNGSGSLDLSNVGGTNFVSQGLNTNGVDFIALAAGSIVDSTSTAGVTLNTSANGNRPGGSIIMAAGDQAAGVSYGTGTGQQAWMIIGGSTKTGGDINLSNVGLKTNGQLAFATAHSGTETGANKAAGAINLGSITTANGTPGTPEKTGHTFLISSGNIRTGAINSNSAYLMSLGGFIGQQNSAISTNVRDLTVITPLGAYINNTGTDLRLGTSIASHLELKTNGSLTVYGKMAAGYGKLTAANSINILSDVTAGIIDIMTGNGISDSNGLQKINAVTGIYLTSKNAGISSASLNTGSLKLSAGGGNIDITTTNAQLLVANNTSGNITVNTTGGVVVGAFVDPATRTVTTDTASSAAGNFSLQSGGDIIVSGKTEAGGTFNMKAGSDSGIYLGSSIKSTGAMTLTAQGKGSIVQLNNKVLVSAPTLTLNVASGNIGAPGLALKTDATTLNFTSAGNVTIYNSNVNHNLDVNAWSGTSLNLTVDGDLTNRGQLLATGMISLSTENGGKLTLDDNVIAGTMVVLNGQGGIEQSKGLLFAPILFASAGSKGITLGNTNSQFIGLLTEGAVSMTNISAAIVTGGVGSLELQNNNNVAVAGLVSQGKLTVHAKGTIIAADSSGTEVSMDTTPDGNIFVTGTLKGTDSVTLKTLGSGVIAQVRAGDKIDAPDLFLFTDGGDIGTNKVFLNTTASQLEFNTGGTGSAFIYNSNANGAINLQSWSGGTLQFVENGIIHVDGALDAKNSLVLGTTNNGFINLNADVKAGEAAIFISGGTGGLKQNAGTLNSPLTVIFAGSGGVELPTLETVSLALTTSGVANVSNTSATLGLLANVGSGSFTTSSDLYIGSIASAGNLTAKAGGDIHTIGQVIGTNVTLQTTGTDGSIDLGDNITGTTSLQLLASGAGNISQKNNAVTVSSPTLTMSTGTGDIGKQDQFMITDATDLTFSTKGSVYIFNSNVNKTLDVKPWSGTTLMLFENGNLNVVGDLNASKNLVLGTFSNGNIVLKANTTAGHSTILNAQGTGGISQDPGKVVTSTVLAMSSGIGGIGPMNTDAFMIAANTLGNMTVSNNQVAVLVASVGGNAVFNNNGALAIISLEAGGNIDVTTNGTILGVGNIFGDKVSMTANNGRMEFASNVIGKSFVHLNTTVGGVSQLFTDNLIAAPEVSIISDKGDIGLALNYLHVSSPNITVATDGDIYLDSRTATKLAVPRAGSIFFTGNGGLELTTDLVSNPKASGQGGTINFTVNNGPLTMKNVTANGTGVGNSAGKIILTATGASGDITTGKITADGKAGANGGFVHLITMTGNIKIPSITVQSESAIGGNVLIDPIMIDIPYINASGIFGGNIGLEASSWINAGVYIADGMWRGGQINLNAPTINAIVLSAAGASGGNIYVTGSNVAVSSAGVTGWGGNGGTFFANVAGTFSADSIAASGAGNGGNVFVNAGGIRIFNSDARGGWNGGVVGLNAAGPIFANFINASGNVSGGQVVLTSGGGIFVDSISATGEVGYGGALYASAPIFASSGYITLYGGGDNEGTAVINAGVIRLANPIRLSRRGTVRGVAPATQFNLNNLINNSFINGVGARAATDFTPANRNAAGKATDELNQFNDVIEPLQGHVSKNKKKESGAMVASKEINSAVISDLGQSGVKLGPGTGGNFLNLDKGNLLVKATKNMTVRTHEGDVLLAAGSLVFVMETGNDVAVFNLHDGGSGKVKVKTGGKEFNLNPGTELVMTRVKDAKFEEVNPGRAVAARDVQEFNLEGGITAFQSDFSIMSAFNQLDYLRGVASSDKKEMKNVVNKVLKTAAALHVVTSGRGAYSANKQVAASGDGTH